MKNIVKKSATLSGINLSESEISEFITDFSDILPLIDKISEFDSDENVKAQKLDFSKLRSDEPKISGFLYDTKSVPKVIS